MIVNLGTDILALIPTIENDMNGIWVTIDTITGNVMMRLTHIAKMSKICLVIMDIVTGNAMSKVIRLPKMSKVRQYFRAYLPFNYSH